MFDIEEEMIKHRSEYNELMQLMTSHNEKYEFGTVGVYVSLMKQIVSLLKTMDDISNEMTTFSLDTDETVLSDIICTSTALHKMADSLL